MAKRNAVDIFGTLREARILLSSSPLSALDRTAEQLCGRGTDFLDTAAIAKNGGYKSFKGRRVSN